MLMITHDQIDLDKLEMELTPIIQKWMGPENGAIKKTIDVPIFTPLAFIPTRDDFELNLAISIESEN